MDGGVPERSEDLAEGRPDAEETAAPEDAELPVQLPLPHERAQQTRDSSVWQAQSPEHA